MTYIYMNLTKIFDYLVFTILFSSLCVSCHFTNNKSFDNVNL